mgnify:FL=1|jgi:tetratricopeptide (TPR) repeat protein
MVKNQILKLGEMVDENKGFVDITTERAERLFLEGQLEAALKEFKSINAFNHSNAVLLLKQGAVYERLGEKEKALAMYYDLLLIEPENPGLNKNLGNYYFSMGENALAVLHWTRYLDVVSGTEDSQLIQSRLNSMAGQLSKGSLEKQVHKLSPEENRKLYNIFLGAQ